MSTKDIEEYRAAVQACVMAAQILSMHDIPGMLNAIERAHALGPVVDPTLWKQKCQAMEEDREMLEAALPLVRIAKKLAAAREQAHAARCGA